jgi:flagellar assembly protein FliH
MSSLWLSAERVTPAAMAAGPLAGFAPWRGGDAGGAPIRLDPREIGFRGGVAEGRAQALAEFEEQRLALVTLAENLASCRADAPDALAEVLFETVSRLVAQVVSEIEVSEALIRDRVDTVAQLIAEQGGPARMRLHPTDIALLGPGSFDFVLVPDPTLPRGEVIVETASGWIEHGADVGIERLRHVLDQLSVLS